MNNHRDGWIYRQPGDKITKIKLTDTLKECVRIQDALMSQEALPDIMYLSPAVDAGRKSIIISLQEKLDSIQVTLEERALLEEIKKGTRVVSEYIPDYAKHLYPQYK